MTSDSALQTNEFVVFDATMTGDYYIIVSSANLVTTKLYEPYALASTHPIEEGPFIIPEPNNPPTLSLSSLPRSSSSGNTVMITADVSDDDNDEVSVAWDVTREDINISLSESSNGLAVSFKVPNHATKTSATFEITATATDSVESVTDDIEITATISPKPKITTHMSNFNDGQLPDFTQSGDEDWEVDTSHRPQPVRQSGQQGPDLK